MNVRDTLYQIIRDVSYQSSENLESDILEFKHYTSDVEFISAPNLPDEISAFSNHKGGLIIIGIKDGKTVKNNDWKQQVAGFPPIDIHFAMQRIRPKLKPIVDIKLIQEQIGDKSFLVIAVPKRYDSLVSTSGGKYYIREGKSSRPMEPSEVEHAVKNLSDYDWSAETLPFACLQNLDGDAVADAKNEFMSTRKPAQLDDGHFLESIGATQNGLLTKSGLLFLGQAKAIREHLGIFEYRFSQKTPDGKLSINDVWDGCLWLTIKRAKAHFEHCNTTVSFTYRGTQYGAPLLDRAAFHEAYLNALVHRDYATDGMVSVNFTQNKLVVSSPGTFYGGITAENIARHEPRHRNKALARMLMVFHLVDRAGMGVARMSLNSLRYGRSFPEFAERSDCIEVIMEGEHLRPGIFVLWTSNETVFGLPELLILNSVYETGVVSVGDIQKKLSKVVKDPWEALGTSMSKLPYLELCGTNDGIFIRVKTDWNEYFGVTKTFKIRSSSGKHVKLHAYLSRHGSASNDDIKRFVGFKHSSLTTAFLKSAKYVRLTGKGPAARWSIKEP